MVIGMAGWGCDTKKHVFRAGYDGKKIDPGTVGGEGDNALSSGRRRANKRYKRKVINLNRQHVRGGCQHRQNDIDIFFNKKTRQVYRIFHSNQLAFSD